MPTSDIAIIGDGAACVSLLRSLISKGNSALINRSIIIFTMPQGLLGAGTAYQSDMETLLLNRPVESMSLDINNDHHCLDWLKRSPELYSKGIDCNKQGMFLPRYIFGQYLNANFLEQLTLAKDMGINVTIVREAVTDIHQNTSHTIETRTGNLYQAQKIVFCCGHSHITDVYQLEDTPSYINNPYPVTQTLKKIKPQDHVAIIGNSLTAIDIVSSLQKNHHQGTITLLSRSNVLPYVRGEIKRLSLTYFNKSEIAAIVRRKGALSLRDLLRLFRKEMRSIGEDWRFIFRINQSDSLQNRLRHELQAAKCYRSWQSILASTNEVIETAWHHLNDKAKTMFLRRYSRVWLNTRSPIPACNAEKLLKLLESGQLKHQAGVEDINYSTQQNQYVVNSSAGMLHCDVVINAAGMSNHIQKSDGLFYRLMEKGQLTRHSFVGISVDFKTTAVKQKDGNIDHSQYVIGQVTSGTYYYTTSLEMIVKRAEVVAEQLLLSFSAESKQRAA